MAYRLYADLLVLLHFAFILFALFGGFIVLWHRWVALPHLACAVWGVLVEFKGWVCPLTPWENALRAKSCQLGYGGGFIEDYLVSLIYPIGLTPQIQVCLGLTALAMNLGIYAYVATRLRLW
jgi:hypothetical protein